MMVRELDTRDLCSEVKVQGEMRVGDGPVDWMSTGRMGKLPATLSGVYTRFIVC